MIEAQAQGEWDTMASLGANLSSLQNFMREMDGKATEEEEALQSPTPCSPRRARRRRSRKPRRARRASRRRRRSPRRSPRRSRRRRRAASRSLSRFPPSSRTSSTAPREEEVPGGDPGAGAAGARAAGAGGRGVPRRLSLRKCSRRERRAPKAKTQTPKAPSRRRAGVTRAFTHAFCVRLRYERRSRVYRLSSTNTHRLRIVTRLLIDRDAEPRRRFRATATAAGANARRGAVVRVAGKRNARATRDANGLGSRRPREFQTRLTRFILRRHRLQAFLVVLELGER